MHRLIQEGAHFQSIRDHLISYRWSPQQIATKLSAMNPEDRCQRVSHETICTAIYGHPDCALKKELVEALCQHKPARALRRFTATQCT